MAMFKVNDKVEVLTDGRGADGGLPDGQFHYRSGKIVEIEYSPHNQKKTITALVAFHGGGWMRTDITKKSKEIRKIKRLTAAHRRINGGCMDLHY